MNEENEKKLEAIETGVLPQREKSDIRPCHDKGCRCREYYNECKVLSWFSGLLILVAVTVVFIFGFLVKQSLESYKFEINELKRNIKNEQEKCDFYVNEFKSRLTKIEKQVDVRKWDSLKEKDSTMSNYEVPEKLHPSSSTEFDNSPITQDHSSDFIYASNSTDNNVHSNAIQNKSREDVTKQVLLTSASDLDVMLQPDKTMCDKLLLLDEQTFEEYSRRCEDLDKRSNRTRRSNSRGPVGTHFMGGVPETVTRDSGLIAPWYPDNKASAAFTLKYEFREGQGTVEVTEEGLYLIYGQVFYLTSEALNGFVIKVREKDSQVRPLAYCSTNAVVPNGGITEATCYTAVIRYLNVTDQVYITQRERNRRMILREGHSFLGLVRLNSVTQPKRRRANRN